MKCVAHPAFREVGRQTIALTSLVFETRPTSVRNPLMTERKVTIASLAAVGLVAMGAGLLAQQSGSQGAGRSGQSVPQKAVTADQGLKILIEARIAIAREILAQDLARLQHLGGGAGDLFAEIPFWSHWLMVDRLRIAATEAERLAAIREHRHRMRVLERLVREYARTGQGRGSDSLKATYYRLEADQFLIEAGGDDATKVEIPARPKRSAFETAATGSHCPSVIRCHEPSGVPARGEHRQNGGARAESVHNHPSRLHAP